MRSKLFEINVAIFVTKKNVKEFEFYLKQRGVFASNLKKQLIHKCIEAQKYIIATDPDGHLITGIKNLKYKEKTIHSRQYFVKITNVMWIKRGLMKW